MKKHLFFLSSLVMILAGCAKEIITENTEESDRTVTFTVGLSTPSTKGSIDGDGEAANINHWVMEVLDADGDRFNYQEVDAPAGGKTHSFDVRLVKGQTYDILFWADTKGDYVVDKLTDVRMIDETGHEANLDRHDAFSAVVTGFQSQQATSQTVILKRPFAQLNVVFTDLNRLFATVGDPAEYAKFKPSDFIVTAKVPTSFNVLTQNAGAPSSTAVKMTAASSYLGNFDSHPDKATLFMDYIFASQNDKDIVNIDFKFTSNGTVVAHSFTSTPFKRNFRTNVLGEFMSSNANWNVRIDPIWDGEYSQEFVAEGSIAAANKALKEGKTAIQITSPSDVSTPVTFPAESDGKDVSINISGVADQTISFVLEQGAQGPANLNLTSDAKNLNIQLPNSHVSVNSGDYTGVTAATSATTLVIGKNTKVENLEITAGNLEIHGIVNNITKSGDCVVTYHIETAEALKALGANISAAPSGSAFIGKIYLDADIDLGNLEWAPINAFQKALYIDGQNHAIKNFKVTESSLDYIGFISSACDLTAKNLTFDTVTLSYPASAGEGARGGVLAGTVWGVNADNCKVKNVTIKACQKLGAFIGYIQGDTNIPNTVTNCSAENVSISSNDPAKILQHGSAGFIGHISLYQNPVTTISGCSVKNITIADYNTAAYSAAELQRVPHVFIGSVCQNYDGNEEPSISAHSIVLSNNTISGNNTVLPTCLYSSDYFGWAGNAEERPAWKGAVYVNGTKWTPDYSYECNGVKYATLTNAIAAAQEGQTINILKEGTYTLPTISKNVVISGKEGVVMNCVGEGSIASIPDGVTFKDIEFNFGNNNYHGFHHAGKVSFTGCVLNGLIYGYGELAYKDCVFNQTTEDVYCVGVYGSPSVSFDNCKFYGTNKAILLYAEKSDSNQTVTVENCTFSATSSTDLKAAVQMNAYSDDCNGKYVVTINNCSISGFQKVYGFKHNPRTVNAEVTVDGKLVYSGTHSLSLSSAADLVEFSAAINGGYNYSGKTVYLENDVDLTGIDWVPAGSVSAYPSKTFAGVFDGQNHTVSNLSCNATESQYATSGLFGSADGTIKNVKLTNVNVSSKHFAGAICGYSSNNGTVIENCHVVGGTVTSVPELIGTEYDNGDKVGGIIGYAIAKDKVLGCSVDGVTIRAYRDLGGIAGFASGTVSNCTVKNSTIVQDNTNAYKESIDTYHEIIGRDNGATLSGNTYSNVTVKSEN